MGQGKGNVYNLWQDIYNSSKNNLKIIIEKLGH